MASPPLPPGQPSGLPVRTLRLRDLIAMVVGVVIGVGIFKTPPLVAGNLGTETMVVASWVIGGIVSLIGALCYAELATAYPHAGGDYHFLARAFGRNVSFLYGWARVTVITSGSIAFLGFALGDYASALLPLPADSSTIYAVLAVLLFTALNAKGIHEGKTAQNLLTSLEVLGLLLIAAAGWSLAAPAATPVPAGAPAEVNLGLAMVFVLLAYGGWSDAACLSAEVTRHRRNIVLGLAIGLLALTALYTAVNLACLHGLGLSGVAVSKAIATDVLGRAWGEPGALIIGVLVVLSILSSLNATIIVGARTAYALGTDWTILGGLGRWHARGGTPLNALLAQAVLVLALIALGATTRDGFTSLVEYTAPVFWLFILLVGVALFVLRWREPERERPFKVPLYPLTPLLFCLTSGYLLYSSLAYTGRGALVGVGVLAAGVPLLLLGRLRQRTAGAQAAQAPADR
jgi:amino acid transporter